jgi:Holliday junction DNA helicase RuvA
MIGWISGKLKGVRGDRVTVDVGGVGYEVLIPSPVAAGLGEEGTSVEFFIHTHVREDAIALFGFPTLPDRDLFDHLIGVTGIGAKTALGILSSIPAADLVRAIREKEVSLLQRTPGIGRKTAERMVLELSDKLRTFEVGTGGEPPHRVRPGTPEEELLSALCNLGYRRNEAEAAVARADLSKSSSFDTMLREALKVLSK